MKILSFILIILGFSTGWCATSSQKIVVVVFENMSLDKTMAQPEFAQFASKGALLTNYFAISHPSQPNYIAMVAGSTLKVSNDSNHDLVGRSLSDLLEEHGKTWHVYAENFPGQCFLGKNKGIYARKHNAFISFTNIQKNAARCANITDATKFADDFKSGAIADFSFYIPNLENDGHNTGVAFAAKWFAKTLAPLFYDKNLMKNRLVFMTFDEDDYSQQNKIFTALLGSSVKPGVQISTKYNHYSLLRTIEDFWQLGTLGQEDQKALPILGFKRF